MHPLSGRERLMRERRQLSMKEGHMSPRVKALGLGIIAMLTTSALTASQSGAETGGHFVSETPSAAITGTEEGTHILHFVSEGGEAGQRIGCDNDHYTGFIWSKTVTEITIQPSWSKCYTTGSPETKFDIHENGCHFLFTIGKNPEGHNTAHLTCPTGIAGIRITHPNCGIVIPPQTVTGVSYKNQGTPHEVTLTSTVKGITVYYHSGICIFLGTTHKSEMNGSLTIKALTDGQTSLTATG